MQQLEIIVADLILLYDNYNTDKIKMIVAATSSKRSMLGFGLVEVMISIAIIGILCGMVVPSLFPVNEYQSIRDQRNAQEIASICAAAQAAGLNFIVPGDLDATVANVLRGGMPASGAFKGRKFIVSGISDQENVREAMRYLRLVDDTLQYNEKAPSNAIASNEGGGTSNT